MSIDRRRITNGLAWAGAFLVVGVPLADVLSAQLMGDAATPARARVAVIEPVAPVPAPVSQRPAAPVVEEKQVAAVTPAKPTPAAPAKPEPKAEDAVEAYLESGRALPSYISGGATASEPAQVAVAQPTRPVITPPPAAEEPVQEIDPVEVAAIPPKKVAPVPMPLSMRPQPVTVALVEDEPVVIPPELTPAMPAAVVRPPAYVTAADLEDWESGPLTEFLAQRQAGTGAVDRGFDPDGFFLDEGPNRRQRDRVIAREVDPFLIFRD